MLLEGLVGEREVGLVERHRHGDASAFAELYERYYPRLLRFCRRRVRDSFTAEELAQDAFMRAYAAFGRLNDDSRFYPWLTVIAKRLIIDHYRRSDRTVPSPHLDPGTVDDASSALLEEAAQQELWRALDRVRGRHQEVLRLRDVEGLSYDAIAERLGTTATTVPPLLHRARKALRREYLALTAAERAMAAPPVTVGVWLAIRRTRDRMMSALSHISDAQVFVPQVAAAAFTAAAVLSGMPTWRDQPPVSAGEVQLSTATPPQGTPRQEALPPLDRSTVEPSRGTSNHSPREGVKIVQVWDEAEREWAREASRNMPIYIEYGEFFVGADPHAAREDVEASLAGDHGWMEEE